MRTSDAFQHTPLMEERPSFLVSGSRDTRTIEFALISVSARLLFVNGQSTESVASAVDQLAQFLEVRGAVFPGWGDLVVCADDGVCSHFEVTSAAPVGVDMRKVSATICVVNGVCDGETDLKTALSLLGEIERLPPISLPRLSLLAAAGAVALGIIFGSIDTLSLSFIAVSAGAGACLRRWLATISRNLLLQSLSAAFLAGVVGDVVSRLKLGQTPGLIAACPCMILVPGAHLLNGTIDLAHARIGLGAARIAYAVVTVLVICTGLLTGLSLGDVSFPVSVPLHLVPLEYDVVAAGMAVAGFGTLFGLTWRMLPIPIAIGMLAHASRWGMISMLGVSAPTGALGACLIVGCIAAPLARRLHLPFAAFAFASSVSLMPGAFVFRMAGGLVELTTLGGKSPVELLLDTIADGATALLVVMAMAFGLIVPKLCIEHFWPATRPAPGSS
jgi:uncharacterized membrane protein YjjP (DUF1212 family)